MLHCGCRITTIRIIGPPLPPCIRGGREQSNGIGDDATIVTLTQVSTDVPAAQKHRPPTVADAAAVAATVAGARPGGTLQEESVA